MSRVKEQVNFNTVLLLIIGALITYGLKKADQLNTAFIQHEVRITNVEKRVDHIEVILPRL